MYTHSHNPLLLRQPRTHLFPLHPTATSHLHPLSLHDTLPIYTWAYSACSTAAMTEVLNAYGYHYRSQEHTSELQSLTNLVCRLLLEKKKNNVIRASTRSLVVITYRL